MKPRVFVGSSVESLEYARAIQLEMEHDTITELWDQGIFQPGDYTLDRLLEQTAKFHFGIFVFSPDDVVKMRQQEHRAARDNVVFEFGLFVSRLGRRRTFFVMPGGTSSLHLPTDLTGVTGASYDPERIPREHLTALKLQPVFAPACARVRGAIQHEWQYYSPLSKLTDRLIFLLRHVERQPIPTSYVAATFGKVMAAFVDRPRGFEGVKGELPPAETIGWGIAAEYACWLLAELGMIRGEPQGSYTVYRITGEGQNLLKWDRAHQQFAAGFDQPVGEHAIQGPRAQ
jgi:predicted nucleotide-binding protein with TIR-like domain